MSTLSDYELDTLREIINIGVGRAAGMLNEMIQKHVVLSVPEIMLVQPNELEEATRDLPDGKLTSVRLAYRGEFQGVASIVFPPDSANKLVNTLTDTDLKDVSDLDSIRMGTLSEVGNIIINGVMGSLSNVLHLRLKYSLPTFSEDTRAELFQHRRINPESPVLLAKTRFTVEALQIEGILYLMFEGGSFEKLLHHLQMLSE